MYGADADALDQLAAQLDGEAQWLTSSSAGLGRSIHASPWTGKNADRFRQHWDAEYHRAMTEAASFLNNAGTTLRRNAREQRIASDVAGGGSGRPARPRPGAAEKPSEPGGSDALDKLSTLLYAMGLSKEAVQAILKGLERVDPKFVKFLTDNEDFLKDLSKLGKVLDITSFLVDFGSDFANHGSLPLDERLVHASAVALAALGEGMAITKASEMLGGVLGSVVPVLGTLGGAAVGHVLGMAASWGLHEADQAWGINDKVGDLALDGYREVKDKAELVAHAAEPVIHGAQNVAHAGAHVATSAAHGASTAGHAIASAASHAPRPHWPF